MSFNKIFYLENNKFQSMNKSIWLKPASTNSLHFQLGAGFSQTVNKFKKFNTYQYAEKQGDIIH